MSNSDDTGIADRREAINRFVKSFLKVVSGVGGEDGIPKREFKQMVEPDEEDERYFPDFNTIEKPDYVSFTYSFDEWESIKGYDQCIGYLESDEEVLSLLELLPESDDDISTEEQITRSILRPFIREYLEDNDEVSYDQETFTNTYSKMERYLDGNIRVRTWAPLLNFDMEMDELELSEQSVIRKITSDERDQLATLAHDPAGGLDLEEARCDFIVENSFKGSFELDTSFIIRDDYILSIATSLRLFEKGGDCRIGSTFTEPDTAFGPYRWVMAHGESGVLTRPLVEGVELTESEAGEFVEFWEDYKEMLTDPSGGLETALGRFSDAVGREKSEDRLLDLIMALEVMMGNGGGYYKISERAALISANEKSEREQIKNTLKEASDMRSKIVHGSTRKADSDLVKELYIITRGVIRMFLQEKNKGKSDSEIRENLDELVLMSPKFQESN